MEVLVSTNEAANILGLSVQGVHYRIKTKKLRSIKKDGKTFVYIDKNKLDSNNLNNSIKEDTQQVNINHEVIKLKDEQISFLKKSIAWITKQNKQEISRLQKSHDNVVDAFKSEISLLQKAYNELHKLYNNPQSVLEKKYEDTDIASKKNTIKPYIDVVDFVDMMLIHGKSRIEIKNIIIQRVKIGDKRFIFNSITKELKILNDQFKDII